MSDPVEMRQCHWCETFVPKSDLCPSCLTFWGERPAPEQMTADEREAEMRTLEWNEVGFERTHKRIEELVGRSVWTHEIGLNWEGLCKEARWEDRPATMNEILDLIPAEKRIVVEIPG